MQINSRQCSNYGYSVTTEKSQFHQRMQIFGTVIKLFYFKLFPFYRNFYGLERNQETSAEIVPDEGFSIWSRKCHFRDSTVLAVHLLI